MEILQKSIQEMDGNTKMRIMDARYYIAKASCKLFDCLINPIPALKYLEKYEGKKDSIQEIIHSLSMQELQGLWKILRNAKYSSNPKDIMLELNANLKKCTSKLI